MPRKVKDETSAPAAGSDAAVKAEIAKGEAQFTDAEKAAPVALAVAKRLRAARKRLNRITDLEGAEAQGKELNADQRETLKSKTGVLAIIDELEKITPLLKEAAAEEVAKGIAAADAKAAARAERRAERERAEQEKAAADTAEDHKEEGPSTPPQENHQDVDHSESTAEATTSPGQTPGGVDRLLSLLYFSQLFSGSSEYVQRAERDSCLSYDQYANEERVLMESDLDRIAKFGGLLLTRHPNKTNSHSEALEECKALAQTWLTEPGAALPDVVAADGTTVGELIGKLEHIMKSDYFTIQPQIQQMHQEGEDGVQPGGTSDGEYRGLAVSQAEAVLEPPPPPPVVPQQHAGGLDLHSSLQPQGLPDTLSGGDLTSLNQIQPQPQPQHQQSGHQQLPTQFYGSGIYAGAASYHPGAKAAFQAVPPTTQFEAPQMPAINFMNSSSLGMDSSSEPSMPAQPPQQPQEESLPKPPAAPQQLQAPQQMQQQQGQGAPPQQPLQAQHSAGGFARAPQQGSGGLNASDAEVPAPGRGRGGDRGGRRGGRGGGGRFGGYRGGPPGEGRGDYRGEGRGYRGGYRGGRGRGPPGGPGGNGGPPQQPQQQPQQQQQGPQ